MIEEKYKAYTIVDGKSRWVIVNENGNIVDRDPRKEELEGVEKELHKIKKRLGYVDGDICCRCIEDCNITDNSLLHPGNTYLEKDENGNETGRHICYKHWKIYYNKYCPNSSYSAIRSVTNCRTGNQKLGSLKEKGDRSQQLACTLYGWEDLNSKNNNYNFPIDCYDPKTGLFHQVRGRRYDSIYKLWNTGNLEREWTKNYKDMILICQDNYGKRIEEIYKLPHIEIKRRKNISIVNKPTDRVGTPTIPWYEKYRTKDLEELKCANDIWQLIEKSKR